MSLTLSLMRPGEREELLEWIGAVDPDWVRPMTALVQHNPVFRDRYSLIARENGRLAGHLMVIPQTTSIAGVAFRTGRVHWVAVDPSRQRAGIGKMMTNWWLRRMAVMGLELSWLVGIEGYYERFDYYYAFPSYDTPLPYTISLDRDRGRPGGDDAAPGFTVRGWDPGLAEATRKLYLKANRNTSCEIRHSLPVWRFLMDRAAREDHLDVIEDNNGIIAGLLWWRVRDGGLNLRYGLAADRGTAGFCIGLLQAIAGRRRLSRLFLHLPPDQVLGRAAVERGGKVRSPYYGSRQGYPGGMVRLNDPAAVLSKLAPALSARLRRSPAGSYQGRVLLDLPVLPIVLEVAGGRVEVSPGPVVKGRFNLISLSREALTQLVVGYRDLESMARQRMVVGGGPELELLAALFPSGYPFLFMTV